MDKDKKLLKEIIKCGRDPIHFMTHYTWVQHPSKGLVKFSMYPYQIETVKNLEKHRKNIVIKSRQIGISETTAQYILWLALFHKDKIIAIVSKSQDASNEIVRRIKMSYKKIPEPLKISKPVKENESEFSLDNRSLVKAYGLTDDVARGKSISFLFIDEAAAISNGFEMWQSVKPTVSNNGRVFIASTPRGSQGWYFEMYTEAEKGKNGFNTMKLPWTVHPEHDQAWFDSESMDMSTSQIKQEFLADFQGSGETFIDELTLNHLKNSLRAPIREEKLGRLWIWKEPVPRHVYAVSLDPSRGDSTDNAGIEVIDCTDDEQVAEFYGVVDKKEQALITLELAVRYNNADVIFDNTGGYGGPVDIVMNDEGYENRFLWVRGTSNIVPYSQRFNYPNNKAIPGFVFSSKTRPILLANLDVTMRQQVINIYSQRFYNELLTFGWTNGKAQAASGYHDDLVMSMCLNFWCRSSTLRRSQSEIDFIMRAPDMIKASNPMEQYKKPLTPEAQLEQIGKKTGALNQNERQRISSFAALMRD